MNEDKIKYLEGYFKARQDFESNVKSYGFGAGTLPSDFTEGLCRYLADLDIYTESKKYDALVKGTTETVEIKTTQRGKTQTTFSASAYPDWVYWMEIDILSGEITIHKIVGSEITDDIKSNTPPRENINLKNYIPANETLNFHFEDGGFLCRKK